MTRAVGSDAGRRDRSGREGGVEGEAMAGAKSMPSIKQEALCCLKSARSLGEFIVNPSSWGADGGWREVSGRWGGRRLSSRLSS